MAALLTARGLVQHAGDRVLFEGLELTIEDRARIGLVGHNGSGKTTLLSLLAGGVEPDGGDIVRRRGLIVGRVEQFLPASLGTRSARDAVLDALPAPRRHETWTVDALLASLGLDDRDREVRCDALSGGQQNRLMLARALVVAPDLLLLDEPTNHLDVATLGVFERALGEFRGALLLVSHDRAFLDAVTSTTFFLRDGRLYRFDMPYSQARAALEDADDAAEARRRAEDRRIEDLRRSADRLATWGRVYDNEKLARRAKSMEKRIEALEAERTFVTGGSPLDLELDASALRAKEVLRVQRLDVHVPGAHASGAQRLLFSVDELLIRPGERVALLGVNGAGKSTFIRKLVDAARGRSRDTAIIVGPQVRLGYYDQELAEVASDDGLSTFISERTAASASAVRQRLIAAGFPFRDHGKSITVMSGGERARALFVLLSLDAPNFLIFDEPTNHIDIAGREQLEEQLLATPAAMLLTAHDRHFLDLVAQRWWWIRDQRLVEVQGPDEYYASLGHASRSPHSEPAIAPPRDDGGAQHADGVLERIVELEALLAADRARKPKFQKRALQVAWQRELERLYASIEAADRSR